MSRVKQMVLGADHGGVDLKDALAAHLRSAYPDMDVVDLGTHGNDSVDYPDFAQAVVEVVLDSAGSAAGILCCGTGIGICMKANRTKGIRAAVVHDAFTAEMAKRHNNANILCMGGRTTSVDRGKQMVDIWLKTPYEGGRHDRRLEKLDR